MFDNLINPRKKWTKYMKKHFERFGLKIDRGITFSPLSYLGTKEAVAKRIRELVEKVAII